MSDALSIHRNLKDSTGLVPRARRYVEMDAAPERVRQVYRRMRPHYDRLHAHRITA